MDANIARVAVLFADPTRAKLVGLLMSGRAHTPTELARSCKVAPPTMSGHLDVLLSAGAVSCTRQGRQRYYTLADQRVADVFESLAFAADPVPVNSLRESVQHRALRQGRSCYDHLAGRAGVELLNRLVEAHRLTVKDGEYGLTDVGACAFELEGIHLDDVISHRRRFAYGCMDWTERRPHLAGALGAAFLTHALGQEWVRRRPDTRALTITDAMSEAVQRLCS